MSVPEHEDRVLIHKLLGHSASNMALLPLEFTDCLSDSPYFRENLHAHEKELEMTSNQIKGMIKQVKELLEAAKVLSRAQRSLANTLSNFTFNCIGTERTDDEIVIAGSLKEFGRLLNTIEDERDRMLERASSTFIEPIDSFRTLQIGAAKEGKKKFDKETTKFCMSLERHLNLSTKKSENSLQEADANLGMEQRHFVQASLEYILKLQEVQERKKFEFVETILSFMYGWLTFYHQGHEVAKDFKSFMTDLQIRLQRTRDNYTATQYEAENLMLKMLEARKSKPQDSGSLNKMYTRQGYLFLLEKKAFGTNWIKHFCQYQKESRRFTMIPYNQTVSKINSTETITLKECVRRMSDSIDKRFCFDVISEEKPSAVYTFQALSEEDRKLWLDAMDGQDPIHMSAGSPNDPSRAEECVLDERGFAFVRKCIEWIEERSLEDQGLYRVVGVASRVNRLIQNALDRRKILSNGSDGFSGSFDMSSEDWEIRTVTSALKQFFRNLPEPLMSFRLHQAFIAAAKQENKNQRVDMIHYLVHDLPAKNFQMLHLLIRHLQKVAAHCDKNLMTISNLSVCFGPTLLRPEDESMSGILDIKFANVVVEILIENCDKIFDTEPAEGLRPPPASVSRFDAAAIASVSPSGVHPMPNQVIYQSRVGSQEQALAAYATIPARGAAHGPSLRSSSSQDQLAQLASGPVQLRYQVPYPPAASHRLGPAPHFPPAPLPGPSPHPYETPINGTRPARPLAVYQPWNSTSHQPPFVQALDVASPSSSGSSSDSGTHPPNFQTPSSSPSNAVFYACGPTRPPPQPLRQAPDPPLPVAPSQSSSLSPQTGRRVRALYNCVGENPAELSFEPNAIIMNVRLSKEPGWLEGTYRGRTGLIPSNYVQFID